MGKTEKRGRQKFTITRHNKYISIFAIFDSTKSVEDIWLLCIYVIYDWTNMNYHYVQWLYNVHTCIICIIYIHYEYKFLLWQLLTCYSVGLTHYCQNIWMNAIILFKYHFHRLVGSIEGIFYLFQMVHLVLPPPEIAPTFLNLNSWSPGAGFITISSTMGINQIKKGKL